MSVSKFVMGTALMATFTIAAANNFAGRSVEDKLRDATSKPEAIMSMMVIKKGDAVLDFLGGGGYYSELLATAVGAQGKVILHNNQAYLPYVDKALEQRLSGNRLPNVTSLVSEYDDLKLGDEQFEHIFLVLGYHDMHYVDKGWEMNIDVVFPQLHAALKPGGQLLIIDHQSAPGRGTKDTKSLHRIEKSFAIKDIESRGFKLLKDSDLLSNQTDDYSQSVFEKSLRRKTDRFVLIFTKQ